MLLELNWSYLRNPFDNTTKGNFKRMMLLARDHHDKLSAAAQTDPFMSNLFTELDVEYKAFNDALQTTNISGDKRQSWTMQIETLMNELPAQVEDWDIRIMFKYRPTTVEYKYLMGDGRTSFYRGTYEGRLAAVRMLATKLADYPSIADIQTDVDAWLVNANAIRTAQQGEEGRQQQAQKQIERARLALAKKMHFVFANLLVKYYEDPIEVENFYELKYLQRSNTIKTLTTGTGNGNIISLKIAANSRKTALKGTFTNGDAFEIKNTGTTDLDIWLSATENSAVPNDVSTISAGATVTYYGDELSDGSASLTTLIIANNTSDDGLIEVTKIAV